jgi:hypothetical protein
MVHVSTGPPAILDGGLSPGRCCPWPPDGRLPSAPEAEALTHLPPCALWCASTGAPWFPGPTMSGYSSSCQGPSAPLHEPGVPWLVVVSPTTSTGMTRLSALVRAHAPVLPPLAASGRASDRGSMQVAVSPCGEADLPDVVSAPPALRAWPPPPAALEGHGPVASPTTAACPPCGPGRRSTMSVQRLPSGTLCEAAVMRACSGPQGCSPPQVAPSAAGTVPQGSCGCSVRAAHGAWLLHASDMLAVCLGPLTAEDWHLIRCAALSAAHPL